MVQKEIYGSVTIVIVSRLEDLEENIRKKAKELKTSNLVPIVHSVTQLDGHHVLTVYGEKESFIVVFHLYSNNETNDANPNVNTQNDTNYLNRVKIDLQEAVKKETGLLANGQICDGQDVVNHLEAIQSLISIIKNV